MGPEMAKIKSERAFGVVIDNWIKMLHQYVAVVKKASSVLGIINKDEHKPHFCGSIHDLWLNSKLNHETIGWFMN